MAVRPVRGFVVPVVGGTVQRRSRLRRAVTYVTAVTVAVGLLPAVPALATPPSSPPDVPAPKSVPVSAVKAKAAAPTPMPKWTLPAVSWPAGGSAVIGVDTAAAGAARAAVRASGGAAQAAPAGTGTPGQLAVRVRGAADDATVNEPRSATELRKYLAASTPPGSVRVDVMGQDLAKRAGIQGVIFSVSRADGVTDPGWVALDVDYSAFGGGCHQGSCRADIQQSGVPGQHRAVGQGHLDASPVACQNSMHGL